MGTFFSIFILCTVVGLEHWAYEENIKTQNALTHTEELQHDYVTKISTLSDLIFFLILKFIS